jgi:hypothetical protein
MNDLRGVALVTVGMLGVVFGLIEGHPLTTHYQAERRGRSRATAQIVVVQWLSSTVLTSWKH